MILAAEQETKVHPKIEIDDIIPGSPALLFAEVINVISGDKVDVKIIEFKFFEDADDLLQILYIFF